MVTEILLNGPEVQRTIETLASEIFDDLGPTFDVIGVAEGGVKIANMLLKAFTKVHNYTPQLGTIDITLYRDDLYTGLERPALGVTNIPFRVESRPILLVDDVIFTGRTIRAALQELGDLGRPKLVRLAVLLDRRHRELPIRSRCT